MRGPATIAWTAPDWSRRSSREVAWSGGSVMIDGTVAADSVRSAMKGRSDSTGSIRRSDNMIPLCRFLIAQRLSHGDPWDMILVTGATGTTGNEVLRLLLEQGVPVRALSRRPETVHGLATTVADFDDPASLGPALDGVSAVYLVTAPPRPTVTHDAALIAAAKATGVERIVKLGAISGADPGTWHHRSEQPVRDSGLDWTILRPAAFASNMLQYAEQIKHGIALPNFTGNGATGVIDPRDIAAVAARALTEDGHSGRTHVLTGPDKLAFADQVAILERTLGTSIDTEDLPIDAARRLLIDGGLDPDNAAEITSGMARHAVGAYAELTDEVARILSRPATSFADWADQHREMFR